MYRLRCWKVAERFNSPYCTRGETRFRSLLALSNSMIEAASTSKPACENSARQGSAKSKTHISAGAIMTVGLFFSVA